ncbi:MULTISPECIES: glycosyltransferase family 2 protein [unclassified Polaromonas]|uniref:glycosyltransferase family 2 protein n=1 Tax=unclassified Polaromonas TaxID=2638319 RepID=UPI000F082B13|nr:MULTISPECIES: glycosyltransferase family 2 protein [unclassified Polaromonas]AYQ27905.1 glycosyltransferase family 2 protein [Polaromonas sp. SP1]QGJ17234.1 glycosyltransferase [Polaromonas sp. Pch-P]
MTTTESQFELTVLMPCLNEAQTLMRCIRSAQRYLADAGVHGEILIADNGSSDGSQQIAMDAGARVIHVAQPGYGAALIAGICSAQGRYVVMGDSDDSYDFSDLSGFLEQLRAGADLVMGNRFRGGILPGAMPFLHRYLGNPVLSFVGRLFFRAKIGDFHCGLRGLSRQAILRLGLVAPGMEFASEMVAKAALAGLRITEVPTTLRPDGRGRPPHLRTWRDGWRHLRFLLLFCPRWLFLYPGLALLVVGLLGFAVLLHGPLDLVTVGLDIHSLLYMAAATVLGAQMVQLAVLTKWMGVLSGVVPPQRWLLRWAPYLKLETGLVLGVGLGALGLAWSVELVLDWRDAGFGAMDPSRTMRGAIPAVTLMILGVQAATAALFAGALHFCWLSPNRQVRP